jgi:hypothetical protein
MNTDRITGLQDRDRGGNVIVPGWVFQIVVNLGWIDSVPCFNSALAELFHWRQEAFVLSSCNPVFSKTCYGHEHTFGHTHSSGRTCAASASIDLLVMVPLRD